MTFLSRFKVLTKIIAVIVLLSVVAGGITALGVRALGLLNDAAARMEARAAKAVLAQQLSVNLVTMNRAEWQMVTDPRTENRTTAWQAVERESKLFHERLAALKGKADGEWTQHLGEVEDGWTNYQKELGMTHRAAEAVANVAVSEQLEQLRKEAAVSAEMANKLRAALLEISKKLNSDVARLSAAATNEYHTTSRLMIVSAAVSILIGLLFGFLIGQYGIVKPIRAVVDLLQKLANSNYDVEVTGVDRRDEVGDIAKAAIVFKENGLAKVRMEHEQREAEQQAASQRKADMEQLADQFERAVGDIIETVSSASTELEAAAGTLTRTAEGTQERSTMVAAASEEASANVQSVATATEEMTSSISEIGRQVQSSAQIAGEAVEQARRTNDRVNALSESATRIGDVIELINTIAGQTNLLALNATIEAARAGEAGRGFAVVASEVKALAEQTAKATGEIGHQISGIQAATQDSVVAIKAIGETIGRISEISSTIASAVEEQGAATQEISRNVQQAALGTHQVASNIADVQQGASETGSASAQVFASARSLSHESNRLKMEVGKFLGTVRAA